MEASLIPGAEAGILVASTLIFAVWRRGQLDKMPAQIRLSVEPGHGRIEALGLEFLGQVLVMLPQGRYLGGKEKRASSRKRANPTYLTELLAGCLHH